VSGQEFIDGYRDGRDPDAPEPSANRSHAYRHSFAVGRAEIETGNPLYGSLDAALAAAAIAEEKDASL
jgi:hypothetical protein